MDDRSEHPVDVEERRVRRGLSPSRAEDFQNCPLKFRYRVIDRRPEPADPAASRGTLVHGVLEKIFDLQASGRDLAAAKDLLPGAWEDLKIEDPRVLDLFDDVAEEQAWLETAVPLLEAYFSVEDPRRLEPAEREMRVELPLPSGLRLTGILDRLDEAPDGRLRIVDYKTGKAPPERYQDRALAQMKFYALVVWRLRGVMPTLLELYYLGSRTVLSYEPNESDLIATERRIEAIWSAIESAIETETFPPRKGPLCKFCHHRDHCPEFGGEVLPFPKVRIV